MHVIINPLTNLHYLYTYPFDEQCNYSNQPLLHLDLIDSKIDVVGGRSTVLQRLHGQRVCGPRERGDRSERGICQVHTSRQGAGAGCFYLV